MANKLSLLEKIKVCKRAIFYFLPIFTSYSIVYYTNQGLFEMVNIKDNELGLDNSAQYRWYQFAYQCGSISGRFIGEYLFRPRNLWIDPILLSVTLVIMLLQVFLVIQIPYITIMFIIITSQGYFANHSYITSLYKVTDDFDERVRPVALTLTGISDITSAFLPAFLGLPTLKAVCALYK